MSAFGLQNQRIQKTPTGRIDSDFLNGADGSDVVPAWSATVPNLNSAVGTPISIDLIATAALVDPGSPSAEIGFYPVSGQTPQAAGFTLSGSVLSNPCAFATFGTFRFVAIRNGISVLSPSIAFAFSTASGTDNVAPTVPTSIAVAQGSAVGTISLTCDAPSDAAPASLAASGSSHIEVLVNGAVAAPPSPVVTPANALQSPTNVNIGTISSPDTPSFSQAAKVWTLSAAGTGIAATTSEQCLFVKFGSFSGAQKFVAKLDPYTSSAGTALAGLMVHETGVAGGKFIAIGLRPSNGTVGLYVESRATAAAASTQVATQINDSDGHPIVGPVYVMIERAADNKTWTVSYSKNELGKTVVTTQTLAMNASVLDGLFCTSQSAGTDATAVIEEVSITSNAGISATINATSPVSIQLRSVDTAGNISALSTAIQAIPLSQAPPAQVQGLTATALTSSSIALGWTALSGASTYTVDRNTVQVATANTNSFTDTGLAASTTYAYTVAANGPGGQGAFSASVNATTLASGGAGPIVWKPGIRIRVGGYGSMSSAASLKSTLDGIFAADINHQIKGICLSPTWAQLEGPTLGDYSAGFAAIGAYITLLKSYSPPRDITIEVNALGNGYSAQTSSGYLSSFAPAYMNSPTYGGGEVHLGTPRPYIIIWNQNVANRLIALFRAYNNQFGPDTATGGIYRWDPFQEISINEGSGGYSPSALLAVWASYMSGLRAAAPNTLIMVKPTFINPNNGASYGTLVPAMFSNHISMANEDCADNRSDWGTNAYLGLWASTPTNYTTNNGGNPGWDFHCNVDPAELFQSANSANYNNVVPPAQYGSGRIYDGAPTNPGIWTRVKTLKASHIDIYVDAFGGPNVNRRTFSASAPPNPSPGPGAGLVASHPNIIDVLTGNTAYSGVVPANTAMPWTIYPVGYP